MNEIGSRPGPPGVAAGRVAIAGRARRAGRTCLVGRRAAQRGHLRERVNQLLLADLRFSYGR